MTLVARTWWRVPLMWCSLLCVTQLVSGSMAPVLRTAGGTDAIGRSRLLKHDRMRLIEALAQNKSQVTVLLAARPRMNEVLVADVLKLNGIVQWRDDDIDYLRVAIEPKRVPELSCSSAIESLNLAGSVDYLSLSDDETQTTTQAAAPRAISVRSIATAITIPASRTRTPARPPGRWRHRRRLHEPALGAAARLPQDAARARHARRRGSARELTRAHNAMTVAVP